MGCWNEGLINCIDLRRSGNPVRGPVHRKYGIAPTGSHGSRARFEIPSEKGLKKLGFPASQGFLGIWEAGNSQKFA